MFRKYMYYGVTQQVMRQDLAHWMLYVAARSDGRHELVSYPYYVKFVQESDSLQLMPKRTHFSGKFSPKCTNSCKKNVSKDVMASIKGVRRLRQLLRGSGTITGRYAYNQFFLSEDVIKETPGHGVQFERH